MNGRGTTIVYSITGLLIAMFKMSVLVPFILNYDRWGLLFIYLFFSLVMRLPIGTIADAINKNSIVAATGCVLVALSFFLEASPVAQVAVMGLGTAIFSSGACVDIMNASGSRAKYIALFAGMSVLGCYFGVIAGDGSPAWRVISALALYALALIILLSSYRNRKDMTSANPPISIKVTPGTSSVIAIIALGVSVFLLGILGTGIFMQNIYALSAPYFFVSICLGVFLGGLLADMTGPVPVIIISLAGNIAFSMLTNVNSASFSVLMLAATAMVLPVAIWAVAAFFCNAKGFAMGLACLVVFVSVMAYYVAVPFALTSFMQLSAVPLYIPLLILDAIIIMLLVFASLRAKKTFKK